MQRKSKIGISPHYDMNCIQNKALLSSKEGTKRTQLGTLNLPNARCPLLEEMKEKSRSRILFSRKYPTCLLMKSKGEPLKRTPASCTALHSKLTQEIDDP
jgi:hypothetical protein